MKKLISTLGALMICVTIIPIVTVSAAPPNNSKAIKTLNNNKEIKKGNSRNNKAPTRSFEHLKVKKIEQEKTSWCGPAIAQSILEFWGFNWDNALNRIRTINYSENYNSFQSYLATLMQTQPDPNGGTNVYNWMNVMNDLITDNPLGLELNRGRQYSIMQMTCVPTNFDSIIRGSLQNNVPVALAYRGNPPSRITVNRGEENHFIIIHGVFTREIFDESSIQIHDYNRRSRIWYNYMDPADGTYETISQEELRLLIGNISSHETGNYNLDSYLIYFDARKKPKTIINQPKKNQTEPRDFSGGAQQSCLINLGGAHSISHKK